jgi:hypothetical protein
MVVVEPQVPLKVLEVVVVMEMAPARMVEEVEASGALVAVHMVVAPEVVPVDSVLVLVLEKSPCLTVTRPVVRRAL